MCRRLQPSCSCRNWGPKLAFAFLPLILRVMRCSARFLVLRSKGEVEVTGETLVCFYFELNIKCWARFGRARAAKVAHGTLPTSGRTRPRDEYCHSSRFDTQTASAQEPCAVLSGNQRLACVQFRADDCAMACVIPPLQSTNLKACQQQLGWLMNNKAAAD